MAFVKGDPRINRKGRPPAKHKEELIEAIANVGKARGKTLWQHVAEQAFEDKQVLIAIVKKFVPDMTSSEISAMVNVVKMPTVTIDGKELQLNIGEEPDGSSECSDNPADACEVVQGTDGN